MFNKTIPNAVELHDPIASISYSHDGLSAYIMDTSDDGYVSVYSVSLKRFLTYYDGTYVLVDESEDFSFYVFLMIELG